MSEALVKKEPVSVKRLLDNPDIKKKFQDMLGERMQGFFVSVSNCVSNNALLQKADPNSVIMAAGIAASLDLPIDQNLGFAYIVPYEQSYQDEKGQWQKKIVAQFQMGVKGYKQLALRSGEFLKINATDVREGELGKKNRLTGNIDFEWIQDDEEREKKKVIGYVSFFELQNGFTHTLYMPYTKVMAHGKKYSQTFKKDKGLWKTDEDAMMLKTVTKLNLSKNAPLSIKPLQRAHQADQAVIKNFDNDVIDAEYIDNTDQSRNIELVELDKQRLRIIEHISASKSLAQLEEVFESVKGDTELSELYSFKLDSLNE